MSAPKVSILAGFMLEHWIALCFISIVAILIRNRFYNGLHKFPGPFAASITNFWRFYDVYKQRPEVTHLKLHKQYGDVVRLGPNALSFADPAALKTIYGLNKGFVKTDFYKVQQPVAQGQPQPSLFSTTDNTFHAQFRRCVNAAFSMSALVQYEPAVDNTTRLFLYQTERLFASEGVRCDFTQWLQFYAFDVIGEITYGKRHGFLEENKDVDGIVGYLGRLFLYVAPVGQMPFLDKLLLKNPIYLALSRMGLIDSTFPVARFAQARMKERLTLKDPRLPMFAQESPTSKPDLLSKFLAAQESRPDFMTDRLVQTMAVSMAFAGSETTAISLAAVFYYLMRTPEAMRRLRQELEDFESRGEFEDMATGIVTWPEAQKLPYLDACIKEAFRLHPAAGLPLERVVPPEGVEIAGHFIKGGTIVGCSAWVIHRRPEIFGEDVDTYRPERWLVDETLSPEAQLQQAADIKRMNSMMIQFGMGSRTCIGKNISLLEIYKLVPSLLRRFEIEFDDPAIEWKFINAWFVKQTDFYVKFTRRSMINEKAG